MIRVIFLDFIINGLSDMLQALLKTYYFATLIKNAFRQSEKLPHFFTIHYYLLLAKKIPQGEKSEEWRVKSEEVKKYPRNKSEEFFWLRRWDLNHMTSGLWARRATRLLYSAILWSLGAGDRDRTGTILSYHGILSPGRLPVPPHRQVTPRDLRPFGSHYVLYHAFFALSTPFPKKLFVSSAFSSTVPDTLCGHTCFYRRIARKCLRGVDKVRVVCYNGVVFL